MADVKRAFPIIYHGAGIYDFKDKERTVDNYVRMMLNRLQKIFKYENLPDTINKVVLETYLLMGGWAYITEVDGKLYAFKGGLGGVLNEYYLPTKVVISNPYLKYYDTLDIKEDGVLMTNDSTWLGLHDLILKYATLLADSELTMRMCNINTRVQTMISAPDDNTAKSAQKYIEDLEAGNIGVIAGNAFLDGVKTHNNSIGTGIMTQNIEYHQYLKGSFYHEIGLDANYNMKRESLSSGETELNQDALKPLIDDMLESRQKAVEKINEKYGTNIKVSFDSVWETKEIEEELMLNEAIVEDVSELDESGDISNNDDETRDTLDE